MDRTLRLVVVGLAVAWLVSFTGVLPAEESGPVAETEPAVAGDDPCPWVPRSGRWKLQAGQMSVGGLWTPLGGGTATMQVRVESCGESIIVTGPPEIGTVVFRPTDRKPPQLPQEYELQYLMFAVAGTELTGEEQEILDAGVRVWLKKGEESDLQEPPEKLKLFEFNLYRGVLSTGTVAWYLDYVTQYQMYSVTLLEGVNAPAHQQFHRWTYLGD